MNVKFRRLAVFSLIFLSGCGLFGKKRDQVAVRPANQDTLPGSPEARPKTLAIASGNTGRELALAEPMPPAPPEETIFDSIPPAKPKNAVAAQPKAPGSAETVVPASGITPLLNETPMLAQANPQPPVVQPKDAAEQPKTTVDQPKTGQAPESAMVAVKRLQQLAAEKMARLEGFEARLVRRETIAGKASPEQVMLFKHRARPLSLHMKWIGPEAKGRELIYVGGRKEEKVEILTAKGDGFALTPAGKRLSFAPTDSTIRGQSRYDLREGGMQMAVTNLGQALAKSERDPSVATRFRFLGREQRRERPAGLEGIEETIPANVEPLFPKGGKRTIYFDPDPSSPSYGLPILVTALDETGVAVEYYSFDQFKPARFTDADFDSEILWKKPR